MNDFKSIRKLGVAMAFSGMMSPASAADLSQSLSQAMSGGACRTPDTVSLDKATSLFGRNFAGDFAKSTLQDWSRLNMQALTPSGESRPGLKAVMETSTAHTGRGFYAFSTVTGKPWVLQAPHGNDDLHTKTIALNLFREGLFAAAAWNTLPRNALVDGGPELADLAHLSNSYYQAFTRAFAQRYPEGRLIQIHGFDKNKRSTVAGATSDMIVSAGVEQATPWVVQVADCLKTKMPGVVRLYPIDVQELGGTTNAQKKLLQQLGHTGFMHVEMSENMRLRLRDDAVVRRDFIGCLR